MSEQEQVEAVLASIENFPFVTEIRHALDDDWSGDPAVRFWVILRDDVLESSEFADHARRVHWTIFEAVNKSEIDRWPYIRFRGKSEQVELDREEAA
jgi:hypothetical protein